MNGYNLQFIIIGIKEFFYFCCFKPFLMQNYIIPASKSISNRLLILQALYPSLKINNLSTALDTVVLQKALQQTGQKDLPVHLNIGHAGTAMRFLSALLSTLDGQIFVLDGSTRMRQRPIKILVEALQNLGADISYLLNEGYPPLRITGKILTGNEVSIAQNVSSQYISALLLIAPKMPKGLTLNLKGEQVSKPYVQMTINILKNLGVRIEETSRFIKVYPAKQIDEQVVNIEGDWTSTSYFYGAIAVLRHTEINLIPFDKESLQGDSKIVELFKSFGITTVFDNPQKIIIKPDKNYQKPDFLSFDLIETPDLAQTIATTCLTMGIKCKLTGLQTLRIKETDRLTALKSEMEKLGAKIKITDKSLEIVSPEITNTKASIDTYDDHRIAMSFAILQKKYPELGINHPEVVVKSFPGFWEIFGQV